MCFMLFFFYVHYCILCVFFLSVFFLFLLLCVFCYLLPSWRNKVYILVNVIVGVAFGLDWPAMVVIFH